MARHRSRLTSCVALLFIAFTGQVFAASQSVDFRNFTFPFPWEESPPVPDKLAWMSLKVKTTVTLVEGRFDFDPRDPSAGPSVILHRVLYGYLTSAKRMDAVVVVGYHTGGTAYWYYVYAYSLAADVPKLVGWFRTGSRADAGLYDLDVSNRSLTVDLLDSERRIADCCSDGFIRTIYDFKDGYFVQRGPQQFGDIVEVPRTRKLTRQ